MFRSRLQTHANYQSPVQTSSDIHNWRRDGSVEKTIVIWTPASRDETRWIVVEIQPLRRTASAADHRLWLVWSLALCGQQLV
jgi:hypothetical protein